MLCVCLCTINIHVCSWSMIMLSPIINLCSSNTFGIWPYTFCMSLYYACTFQYNLCTLNTCPYVLSNNLSRFKYILLHVNVIDCVPKQAPNYLLMFVRICICNSKDQAWKKICSRLECNYNTCCKIGKGKSFWLFA